MKNPQRELLRNLLAKSDAGEFRLTVERLLAGTRKNRDESFVAELISDAVDERIACSAADDERRDWARWVETLASNNPSLAQWLRARELTSLGDFQASSAAWDACIAALPVLAVEAFLHRAAVRIQSAALSGAAADIRFALRETTDAVVWNRASQLIAKLLHNEQNACTRELKIALLSGKGATALVAPLLLSACFREGIAAKVTEGDYDQLRQEVLAPDSWLYRSAADIIVCHTHWRDASLPEFSANPQADVRAVVETQTALWKELRARTTATVIAYTFDLPTHDAYGRLGQQLPGGRGHMLREVNAQLRGIATEMGVVLVDLEQIASEAGADAWTDSRQWFLAKQHPATAGAVHLVDRLAITMRAALGQTKKVLVLDLDNVLWGGVIGEDGLERIELGKTSALGEAFAAFQSYARDLKDRGILLAVCSKNNDADAKAPFESHPDSVLKLTDFAAFFANWDDKVTNLRRIAETLSLGLESFVFCDDNPVERAWVRSQLPEVAVPELPTDPTYYIDALDRTRWFESITFSEEDRRRHQQYQENAARESLRSSAHSLAEFLADLQMIATHGPIRSADLARVAQLVNKTNQFNLTTRRYTSAQLEAQSQDAGWWTSWFRLTDRFGDHGLVGLITLKPSEHDAGGLEVDNWLMSCRVLGRTLEALMLAKAIEECGRRGVSRLYGRYLATAKNGQVAQLYENFGFAPVANEESLWMLDLATATLPATSIPQCVRE